MKKHIIRTVISIILLVSLFGMEVMAGDVVAGSELELLQVETTSETDDSIEDDSNVEAGVSEVSEDVTEGVEAETTEETGNEADVEIAEETDDVSDAETEAVDVSVVYQAHCQTYGWFSAVSNGEEAGITGKSKRMEALTISFDHAEYNTEVSYSVHAQGIGWMDAVQGGRIAGTTGESRRLEAITISLSGTMAENYDIYYCVHSQTYGWLGWAKNGEVAGTTGLSKRLEAIKIMLVAKGTDGPTSTVPSSYSSASGASVSYSAHVRKVGWQDAVSDGSIAGTQGQSLRMEALKIDLKNPVDASGNVIDGTLSYQAYVQGSGWQDAVSEGEIAGTVGQSLAIQGIKISLSGNVANSYDIYYRVHCATFGTLGWAKNGELAGLTDYNKDIQSIEILVVKQGDSSAPDQSELAGCSTDYFTDISVASYAVQDSYTGWLEAVSNNEDSGLPNEEVDLTAIKMSVDTEFSGSIVYQVHVATNGWLDEVSDGAVAGSEGGKQIQAIKISLTGDLGKFCDVYYKTNVEGNGWIGWAKNGEAAGSTGCGYSMEAVQVYILPKGSAAPGITSNYLITEVSEETQNDDYVWEYLMNQIGNAYGVAGLMGNLYAESLIRSNNLQNSSEKSSGYTDYTYTAAVDDGSYTAFCTDSFGYGIAQWTTSGRKTNLKNYADSVGVSIGNLRMQLAFLMQELEGEYSSVLTTLKTAESVKDASDAVLTKFEMPADQSDTVKEKRASYGETYYDKYVEDEEE